MTELFTYLNNGIESIVKKALKSALKNPREILFLNRFQAVSRKAAAKRTSASPDGLSIPPFLIASIAEACNLRCKGCYNAARHCGDSLLLPVERWDSLFTEAADLGVSFILLAGGEPFMRPEVIHAAANHPDIIFPIFTNGTLLDEKWVSYLNSNRNLVPILSIEGGRIQTDLRRGEGVYRQLCAAMEALKKQDILFGVSITVSADNLDEVTGEPFVSFLAEQGASVCIFVEYVPTDPDTAALALSDEQQLHLAQRLESVRTLYPMIILSFPGDEKEMGGCMAAGRGFFHINASGGAEPCPFSPYSDMNLKDYSLLEALQSPFFQKLRASEFLLAEHSGGCVLFSQREDVEKLL